MKKVLLSAVMLAVLVVSFAGIAGAAPMSPAQICKAGGAEYISDTLEDALYMAHGVMADINISQGACASTVATHMNPNGMVNTQPLATSFCKEVGAEDLQFCVEHVEPTLLDIFHGS